MDVFLYSQNMPAFLRSGNHKWVRTVKDVIPFLILMLLVSNFTIQNDAKKLKKNCNPGMWVLI